jgi:hypothetical protein
VAIASDPLDALRTYIEHVAQDPDAPADERASRLQRLRDDLEVTLGAVDDYLGRALKRVEAERMIAAEDEQRVRDNATMREELLRTGVATERELDEAGFISQEEITRLEEEGLFEATVAEIASKWVQETSFAPQQHLRDRKGRFRDMPDAITHAIVPEGMGARTELATRKARTDMEFARDRALPVIVWAKGTSVTGNVRSVGAATVTIEDGDGTGHRIKWEDVERTVVRTADGARTTGFGRGERPRPASAPKPAATAPNTDPNASQKAHKYAEFKTPVTVSDAFYQKIDGIIRGAGSDGFTIIDREGAAHIVNYNAVTSIRPARGLLIADAATH